MCGGSCLDCRPAQLYPRTRGCFDSYHDTYRTTTSRNGGGMGVAVVPRQYIVCIEFRGRDRRSCAGGRSRISRGGSLAGPGPSRAATLNQWSHRRGDGGPGDRDLCLYFSLANGCANGRRHAGPNSSGYSRSHGRSYRRRDPGPHGSRNAGCHRGPDPCSHRGSHRGPDGCSPDSRADGRHANRHGHYCDPGSRNRRLVAVRIR